MNLHKVVADLIEAQNNQDSLAYAACFDDKAVVFDEGKTHKGKTEIQQWIEDANHAYMTRLKPLSFEETGTGHLLTAEASGTFPGSPAVLTFHLKLQNELIQALKITG
jgi:ketosteroid isomerase-like protein